MSPIPLDGTQKSRAGYPTLPTSKKKKKKSRQVSLTVRQKLKIIRRSKGENRLIFTKLRSCELNISTTFIDTEVF